jgi:hypothetical protein
MHNQLKIPGPNKAFTEKGTCVFDTNPTPFPPLPPKPTSRVGKVSLWAYFKLFKNDILSAQPAHLYRAWMAELRTPFFRSYLCNDPALVDLVLK